MNKPIFQLYRLSALFIIALSVSISAMAQKQQIYIYRNNVAGVVQTDTVAVEGNKSYVAVPNSDINVLELSSSGGRISSYNLVRRLSLTKRNSQDMMEVLASNIGKRVKVVTAYQDPMEGTIALVSRSGNDSRGVMQLKTNKSFHLLDISKLESVEFLEQPVVLATEMADFLQITWETPPSARPVIRMSYLTDNAGWETRYNISLAPGGQAQWVADYVVNNNTGMDWNNAEITLVEGSPYLNASREPRPMLYRMNKMEESSMDRGAMGDDGGQTYNTNFVTVKTTSLTLATGAQAVIRLNEAKTTFTEGFLLQQRGDMNYYPNKIVYSPVPRHVVSLLNSSSNTWLSGSAYVNKAVDGRNYVMGNAQMPATPPKGYANLELEYENNIKVDTRESEIRRKKHKGGGDTSSLELVTVQVTMRVMNTRATPATLEIARELYGNPEKSSEEWEQLKIEGSEYNVNPTFEMRWRMNLKAGESRIVTYTYTVLAAAPVNRTMRIQEE